nr:hypothetical protein [Tanacetum cinerariifolium]
RQPRAHRGRSPPRVQQIRRQHGHRGFGLLHVQARRPVPVRPGRRRRQADGRRAGSRRRRRGPGRRRRLRGAVRPERLRRRQAGA